LQDVLIHLVIHSLVFDTFFFSLRKLASNGSTVKVTCIYVIIDDKFHIGFMKTIYDA